jgi:hypothetical protein
VYLKFIEQEKFIMKPIRYKLVPEQDTQQEPSQPPEPRCRFRWAVFVGVPLVIAAVLFLLNGIDPSFEIEDLLYKLKVINQNRYIRMMCLMVVCIAVLLIVKLFKNKSE